MKLLPKCGTKTLGMISTILGCFCSFFNWEGAKSGQAKSLCENKKKLTSITFQFSFKTRFIIEV